MKNILNRGKQALYIFTILIILLSSVVGIKKYLEILGEEILLKKLFLKEVIFPFGFGGELVLLSIPTVLFPITLFL